MFYADVAGLKFTASYISQRKDAKIPANEKMKLLLDLRKVIKK